MARMRALSEAKGRGPRNGRFPSWFLCRTHDYFTDETGRLLRDDHSHRERDVLRSQHPLARLSGRFAGRKAGIGGTGTDNGCPDPILTHFFRKRFREADDSELGGAV